jgi:hypothetical protein
MNTSKRPRKTPKEKVAEHLRKLGYAVESEDIRHVHGGRYKTLNDVLECWSVMCGDVEIQGGATLTACASGIELRKNTSQTCLYGDFIAYPLKRKQ